MRVLQAVVLWLLCVAGLQAQITVVPTVKHLTSTSTPNAGTITLNVSGGTSPYSYTWTPGPVYTKDITNKAKNTYVVKVKDATAATVTYTYNLGYKADWDQMYGCFSRNDSLIGEASRTWSQAITKNNLAASTNGHVEYILKGMGETKVFGVLDSLSPMLDTYYDIDYGYYYDGVNNYLYEVIYGSLSNPVSGYPEGTALRIERSGSTIKFVVNGVATHTLSDASAAAKVLKVKAMLYSDMVGNSFVNMGCSFATKGGVTFKNYSNLVPFVTHSSGSGSTDGSIRIKPLKTGTYTYTWQPGAIASATLSSKTAGTYSVSAKDATNTITPKNYNIGYKVNWDQPYACSIKHDTLITDESYSWGSAISKNTLPGGTDGWFEYVLRDMNQYRIVGFTSGLSLNPQDIYDIDYGFYYESGTLYSFGESGYFVPMIYQVLEGTVLRVERRGDTVEYKINGNRYSYAVDAASAAKDWKVKGTVYGAYGSSLVNVGCSFYGQGNSNFPNYNRLVPYITHASNSGTADGSVSVAPVQSGSYTYTWQPGTVTGNTTGSQAAGNYSVTVKDALNNQNTLTYNIGYKVQWDRFNGSERRGDTLIYKSSEGITWGTAVSKNTLPGGTDGWVEYIFRNPAQTFEVGFLDSLSSDVENIYDIDYGYYYEGSNGNLYVMANGSYFVHVATHPPVGGVLRVERVGDTVRFWMNGSVLATYIDPVAVQNSWKIKGIVHAGNTSSLVNLGCSFDNQGYAYFPNYTRLIPEIVHASSPGANDGSIRVTPRQEGAYNYAWEPGGETTNTLSAKAAGNYKLMIQDALHHLNQLPYQIGYKVYWDSLYGAETNGDTLVVTTPATEWGRGVSKNQLAGGTDGWVEYVLQDLDDYKFVGFIDSLSPYPEDFYDLDYAFYYQGNTTTLYTIAEGNWTAARYHLPVGSRLRIDRIGDTIVFTVDGIVVNSLVNAVETAKAWKLKAMVDIVGTSSLINVGCSFGVSRSMHSLASVTNAGADGLGGISLNLSGGTPHYNIAWNGYQVADNQQYYAMLDSALAVSDSLLLYAKLDSLRRRQVLSDVPSAIYNNVVVDHAGDTLRMTVLLGNDFGWIAQGGIEGDTCVIPVDTASGFTVHYGLGQKLTKTATGNNALYALSDGVIQASDRAFYTEFQIERDADEMLLGYRTADSLVADTTVADMLQHTMLYMKGNGSNQLKIYYNSSVVASTDYFSGDVIGVLFDPQNHQIVYSRNYTPVWTQSAVPDAFYQQNYQLKALLKTPGAIIKNIIQVGQLLPRKGISGTTSDVTCALAVNGSLSFNAYSMLLGEVPCGYTVSGPGGYTSSGSGGGGTLTGLSAGVYNVTVQFRSGSCSGAVMSPAQQTFTIAYMPDWINQSPLGATNVNTTDRSFNITTTQSNPYSWLGGASTTNLLDASEDGWAEFKPVFSSPGMLINRAMAFGLNSQDFDTNPSHIDHRFYIADNSLLSLAGLGGGSTFGAYTAVMFSLGNIGSINSVSPTDVLKVKKTAVNGGLQMKIDFYKNNVLLGSSNTMPSTELIADVSVNQKNLYISKPRISFGCDIRVPHYFILKKVLDAGYYNSYRKSIYFAFEEEYFDPAQGTAGSLSYTIVSDKNIPVASPPGLIERIGDNRFTIDLSTVSGMTQGEYYRIAITNKKNEVFYARFKY